MLFRHDMAKALVIEPLFPKHTLEYYRISPNIGLCKPKSPSLKVQELKLSNICISSSIKAQA